MRLITRVEPPGKMDTADYLTLCEVEVGNWYIQLSKDAENPRWEHLGISCCSDILLRLIDILK